MTSPAPVTGSPPPRRSRRAAFTLAEVMVASVILAMVTVGALAMVMQAYKISAACRLKDSARGILRTYGDQFLRLTTTERHTDGATYTRWLFNVSNGDTSQGMRWDAPNSYGVMEYRLSDDMTTVAMGTGPLKVPMRSDGDNVIDATITRNVVYVDPATGKPATGRLSKAAGYQLQATFTATYVFSGEVSKVSITVLRAVP